MSDERRDYVYVAFRRARSSRAIARAKRGANQSQLRLGSAAAAGGGRSNASPRTRDDAGETRARRTDAAEMF